MPGGRACTLRSCPSVSLQQGKCHLRKQDLRCQPMQGARESAPCQRLSVWGCLSPLRAGAQLQFQWEPRSVSWLMRARKEEVRGTPGKRGCRPSPPPLPPPKSVVSFLPSQLASLRKIQKWPHPPAQGRDPDPYPHQPKGGDPRVFRKRAGTELARGLGRNGVCAEARGVARGDSLRLHTRKSPGPSASRTLSGATLASPGDVCGEKDPVLTRGRPRLPPARAARPRLAPRRVAFRSHGK